MSLSPERKTPSSVRSSQRPRPSFWTLLADIAQDINSELDELDREEFYRLKKVANKKQRDTAASDAELKKKMEAEDKETARASGGQGPSDLLGENEDDDVIF